MSEWERSWERYIFCREIKDQGNQYEYRKSQTQFCFDCSLVAPITGLGIDSFWICFKLSDGSYSGQFSIKIAVFPQNKFNKSFHNKWPLCIKINWSIIEILKNDGNIDYLFIVFFLQILKKYGYKKANIIRNSGNVCSFRNNVQSRSSLHKKKLYFWHLTLLENDHN